MAPPPSQESFTFTVGKLGEIPVQRDPRLLLILLVLDAGMAVGPEVFMEYAKLNRVLLRFACLDPSGRARQSHRVSVVITASSIVNIAVY
jgi:hypothetical protein